MKPMPAVPLAAAMMAGSFVLGRLTSPEPESTTVVDSFSEVRTVYVSRTVEASSSSSSKGRTVIRKVIEPCDCRASRMVLEERTTEGETSETSSLRLDLEGISGRSYSTSRTDSRTSPKAWSVDILTGIDSSLDVSIGAASSRQVGGISVGAWGLYTPQRKRVTAGVSAGVRF